MDLMASSTWQLVDWEDTIHFLATCTVFGYLFNVIIHIGPPKILSSKSLHSESETTFFATREFLILFYLSVDQ